MLSLLFKTPSLMFQLLWQNQSLCSDFSILKWLVPICVLVAFQVTDYGLPLAEKNRKLTSCYFLFSRMASCLISDFTHSSDVRQLFSILLLFYVYMCFPSSNRFKFSVIRYLILHIASDKPTLPVPSTRPGKEQMLNIYQRLENEEETIKSEDSCTTM